MGIFDNLREAKTYEDGEKGPEGDHVIRIKRCLEKMSGQMGCPLFIVEYEIVESKTAPVGKQYGWPQNFKDFNVGKSALKQFVLAVLGADKDRDAAHYVQCEAQCEAAGQASVSQGLFNDRLVRVNIREIKTKAGHPFKKHTFSPYVATA